MDDPKTITDIKSSFIRSQVRLLSAPLNPSSTWQTQLQPLPENIPNLSKPTTEEIVAKVNKKIQSHNRMVFSTQSQRHVAEQIDALYWRDVLANHEAGLIQDPEATIITRDTDLCEADAITSLPEHYDDLHVSAEHVRDEQERQRYDQLRERLAELKDARDELQRKVRTYGQLQRLLSPLENAQENIQPNLVTRDGELSKELDRMRVLLARVTGKMGELERYPRKAVSQEVAMTDDQKLANVLGLR